MAHGDITHIDIPASDFDRAKQFYGGVFGWEISAPPGFEDYPMWRAPNQISGGGLAPRGDGFEQPRSYIEVDSIDQALEQISGLGGEVVMGKQPITDTSWWATFRDPDGNVLGLYEGTTDVAEQ